MFGLMEPHLKRSTDHRKHIWKRIMRETKYLKIMLRMEIATLIQREELCETGLLKETTRFRMPCSFKSQNKNYSSFHSSVNADQMHENLLCALYCWKHWMEVKGTLVLGLL